MNIAIGRFNIIYSQTACFIWKLYIIYGPDFSSFLYDIMVAYIPCHIGTPIPQWLEQCSANFKVRFRLNQATSASEIFTQVDTPQQYVPGMTNSGDKEPIHSLPPQICIIIFIPTFKIMSLTIIIPTPPHYPVLLLFYT